MLTDKRILITGGAGFLATSLTAQLKDRAVHLVRVDRPGTPFPVLPGPASISDVEADITAPDAWDRLLDGVDVVFHLAAQTSVYVADEQPRADLDINVLPVLNLIETCRRRGWQPAVIMAGTVTQCGLAPRLPVDESCADRPITVYDLHKLMAESYLRQFAAKSVVCGCCLRMANLYGPGPKSSRADRGVLNLMVRKALAGEPLTVYGDGMHLRDYLYVDDAASAFVAAAEHRERLSGQYFVIGTGTGHTIRDAFGLVAERVAARTGRRAAVQHVTPPASLSPIEERDFVADSRRFIGLTGWQPSVALSDGIDRTIEWVLGQGDKRG
ncbi:MAG: hypothetical protein A3K19_28440 [Lentisphaerae bacterium RIFOXYB12_FULL_65_16]|nr:MAG: hypothetical protein A3K18_19690 [Lentisphaerae bacterium RIFOXYA12_64_32]OGV85540.1 MAG: hypothetical protein A3K19_28440 [Lentisphaerae bacterium RIFOXYB12_FULL_65_16]